MQATPPSIWDVYQEGSRFFMKEGDVYETLRALATRLREEGLEYALIGGLALAAHGYRRFTEDVDILMTPETLRLFKEKFVGLGYLPAFATASKSFRDTRTGVKVEVMTTGEYPGDGKPKPVAFPDPVLARVERDGLWVLALEKLVELKLASGLSASHRLKDLADVQELIAILKLPLELAGQLDASVRAEYQRLWQGAQTAPPEEGMS
ncbi:MAG: hypothetical protein HYZ49_13305 [Chloroflexi bacterium]|nr:hypothetical protein [Chloroflexota bacterium]